MSTIYHIAKLTGFSPTTVSKVINNYPDVSDKTRAKIQQVLKEQNFQPSYQAQILSTKKTWTFGIVYFEELGLGLSHPFFSKVIESFKKRSDKYGYSLLFGSKNDKLKNDTFLEYFNYRGVDGIAIICTDPEDKEAMEMIESDFPTVVFDRFSVATSSVASDNIQGCKLAVDYLYELGHRKIAHITGVHEDRNWVSDIRIEGFKKSMKDLKLKIPKGYIANGLNFDASGGYDAMKSLLALKDIPTAVFVSGDKMAIGAMEAIRDAGMSVPDDISIIGFDDIELASYVTPKLTTIRQNCEEMGKVAVDLLIEQIENKEKLKINKVIPVELIRRDSCKKID